MEFTLGFIKNDKQVSLRTFNLEGESSAKLVNIEELEDMAPQALFFNSTGINDETRALVTKLAGLMPVRSKNEADLTYEEFEKLECDNARGFFLRTSEAWTIQNNLATLKELFPLIHHLKKLYPNDRTTFFEELWNNIRANLATSELTLIYNDLDKGEKEGDRPKLIRAKVSGTTKGSPEVGGELEEKLMNHYENDFGEHFEVIEYKSDRAELVATMTIGKSPVLMMAKTPQITKLQTSLLTALIDGLA